MHMTVETITPQQAAEYLAANNMNRPLIPEWVKRLAASMRRGEWTLNGEALKISTDGQILDGQHRLHAIVKSGVTVPMVVMRHLPRTVFPTLDQGKRRSASDAFAIAGHKNTRTIAAAVRAIDCIERGGAFGRFLTVPESREIFARHPLVEKWASFYASTKIARQILPISIVGLVTLGEEKHGEDVAGYFFDRLVSGAGLEEKSPILLLRERMIESRRGSLRMTYAGQVTIAVKAWNAYVSGKKTGILRYNSKEEFPGML